MYTQIPKESMEVKHGKLVCPLIQMFYQVEDFSDMTIYAILSKEDLKPQRSLIKIHLPQIQTLFQNYSIPSLWLGIF